MARRILLSRAGGGGISSVPFHPAPSVGHELGVMFGGIAAMVIGALLFYIWWRWNLRRELAREENRVMDLKRRGLLDSGGKEREERVAVARS